MLVTSRRYRSISAESKIAKVIQPNATVSSRTSIRIHISRLYARFKNSYSATCFLHLVPFVYWIKRYPWGKYFLRDAIAGLTVSVILVPQGLAYAQLADCPPVVGLYMGVFPVFLFAFLTTSKHVAYGPMALICLMTDTVITNVQEDEGYADISRIDIGTAVSFTVGIWLFICFILRLGCICSLMSKTFISSFTAGVSVHVFSSQLKEVLGIALHKHYGYFGIVKLYTETFSRIKETNLISMGIAVTIIAILEIVNYFMKPIRIKSFQFTLPLEFILMVIGGIISYFTKLHENYSVAVVGDVPMGFPIPSVPPLNIIPLVLMKSLIIAIVAYFITLSVAFYFSSLKKYKVDPTHEFFAKGAANLFGSFFCCLPCCASISRSVVQSRAGGETQIATLVAVIILILALFLIASILAPIPRSLLAGIIMSSVISVFRNCAKDLALLWTISHRELYMWTVIFLVVVFLTIEVGLACGLFVSLVISIIHVSNPVMYLVGRQAVGEGRNVYTRLKNEVGNEIPGIKIIRISGSVSFITRDHIRKRVYELVGFSPKEINKVVEETSRDEADGVLNALELTTVEFKGANSDPEDYTVVDVARRRVQYIVLDTTLSRFVDYSGMQSLAALASAYDEVGVGVVVVANDAQVSPIRDVDLTVRQLEAILQDSAAARTDRPRAPTPRKMLKPRVAFVVIQLIAITLLLGRYLGIIPMIIIGLNLMLAVLILRSEWYQPSASALHPSPERHVIAGGQSQEHTTGRRRSRLTANARTRARTRAIRNAYRAGQRHTMTQMNTWTSQSSEGSVPVQLSALRNSSDRDFIVEMMMKPPAEPVLENDSKDRTDLQKDEDNSKSIQNNVEATEAKNSSPQRPQSKCRSNCREALRQLRRRWALDSTVWGWNWGPPTRWSSSRWRTRLITDVPAGVLAALVQLPHALAVARLCGVDAAAGCRTAALASLVYALFGPSPALAPGPSALLCLLTRDALWQYYPINTEPLAAMQACARASAAAAVAAGTRVLLVATLGGVFGAVAVSEAVLDALLVAAAAHAVAAALPDGVGAPDPQIHAGLIAFWWNSAEAFVGGYVTRSATAPGLMVCTFLLTLFCSLMITPVLLSRLRRRGTGEQGKCRLRLFIPAEIVLLVAARTLAELLPSPSNEPSLTLGPQTEGLAPSLPNMAVSWNSYVMAAVIVLAAHSQVLEEARKHHHAPVNTYQELVAFAACDVLGCFFGCVPVTASPHASAVLAALGARSQLANVVSGVVLLSALWVLPWFADGLPRAALAGVLLFNVCGFFTHFAYLKVIWKISRMEFFVWMVTFLMSMGVGMAFGLCAGMGIHLLSDFLFSYGPRLFVLGKRSIPVGGGKKTLLFVNIEDNTSDEIPGVKLICLHGPMDFHSKPKVKKEIFNLTNVNPEEIEEEIEEMRFVKMNEDEIAEKIEENTIASFKIHGSSSEGSFVVTKFMRLNNIIIDCTEPGVMDLSGASCLKEIQEYYNKINVEMTCVSGISFISKYSNVSEAVGAVLHKQNNESVSA